MSKPELSFLFCQWDTNELFYMFSSYLSIVLSLRIRMPGREDDSVGKVLYTLAHLRQPMESAWGPGTQQSSSARWVESEESLVIAGQSS